MSTGLTLTRLKDFSPCLEKAVRFTMAAVEPYTGDKKEEEGWTKIYLTINVKTETEQTMLLASLHNTTLPNQALDFLVTPMDNLKICCEGASKRVFLTGHWLEEDEDDMSDDYSYDEDDLDEDELMDDDEDDDEDDDDSDDKRVVELGMDDEDSEDDDEEDDEEEEEVEEAPVAAKRKLAAKETPKKKIKEEPTPSKADKKTPKKEEKTPKKEEKTPKKEEKTPKKEATSAKKTPAKTPGKQVIAGGVVVQDFKVGDGKKATKGKRCSMYYEGRLANGKVFDSTKSGKGFAFRLGGGEVIKGWDVGVEGMQVGGQRRLTIPPAFAYGKKGAPPDIPKNATLTFDVQLVNVK